MAGSNTETPVQGASTPPQMPAGVPERRLALAWWDIWLLAAAQLVVAVPTMIIEEDWHGSPMIDRRGGLWIMPLLVMIATLLAGGALASQLRPLRATRHALVSTGLVMLVLISAAVARRYLFGHTGIPGTVYGLWCAGVVVALGLSRIGAALGRRLRRRS